MSSDSAALNLINSLLSYIEVNTSSSTNPPTQPTESSVNSSPSVKKSKKKKKKSKMSTEENQVKDTQTLPNCYQKGSTPLKDVDPEVYNLIKGEERRQEEGLELIASENFTSLAVMEAVGSCLTNKYSEGLPGKRYYGGNQEIDKLENLCRKRALLLYGLDPEEWGVNVQPYSGSTANFCAMNGLLDVNDRIMGLHLTDGGHLSHGFYRGHKSINCSAKYFQSLPYGIDPKTGFIDYDKMQELAYRFCPKLLIGGSSAYPRDWDYKRMRKIADKCKAYLMIDMAHFSGLVASKLINNPFEYADVVTTTTHKSLRSTRASMIFYRKKYEKQIDYSVFPGCQGGPHNHAIAGIAVALREALTPEFKEYSRNVILNCQTLAKELINLKQTIVTGGTDTHLLLWDLRPLKLTGSKFELICDEVNITINKNTVHGDKSALTPGGVRVGTPALTSRGLNQNDFKQVAYFLHEALQLALKIQEKAGSTKLKDFKQLLFNDFPGVKELKQKVEKFSKQFHMPGRKL